MSLRILHVLSSDFYAGSVAYAVQLAEMQLKEGNSVYIVSDKSQLSEKVTCLELPVSKRSLPQRIKNILFLKKVIRKYHIDIIHAHSRAASWISYYAVGSSKVALVSTIHGRQVKHKNRFKKYDVYGNKVIAICDNLKQQLIEEIGLNKDRISCISNLFDFEKLNAVQRSNKDNNKIIISVIGRFNGPKGENMACLLAKVFPHILQKYESAEIHFIGNGWEAMPEFGKVAFNQLKEKYGERVQNVGFTCKVNEYIAKSDLIIGGGRVAIEAIIMNIPVFAMGEACYHGLVNQSNIEEAIRSNFGDILPQPAHFTPDADRFIDELEVFISDKKNLDNNLLEYMNRFRNDFVVTEITKLYQSAIMQKMVKGSIPVLMYHRVVDHPYDSHHRTFVTRKNFEKQMKFFKLRGLKSLTFRDYLAFSSGDLPLQSFPKKPIILTFDDGYADNHTNMLPVAEKYGFKGVLFLLGDFSTDRNFWDPGEPEEHNRLMTEAEKRCFVDHNWEIGAHTLSHPDLVKLSDEQVLLEISQSKINIESTLQTKVVSFAYPYGSQDERVKRLAKQTGIEFGICTDKGGMNIEEDRLGIFRVNMFPEESYFSLFKKTSSWYRSYYRWKRG